MSSSCRALADILEPPGWLGMVEWEMAWLRLRLHEGDGSDNDGNIVVVVGDVHSCRRVCSRSKVQWGRVVDDALTQHVDQGATMTNDVVGRCRPLSLTCPRSW